MADHLPFADHLEAYLQLSLQVSAFLLLREHRGADTPRHKLMVVLHIGDHLVQLLWRVPGEVSKQPMHHVFQLLC